MLHRGRGLTTIGLPTALGELLSQVSLVGRLVCVRLRAVSTYRKVLGAGEQVSTPSVFTSVSTWPVSSRWYKESVGCRSTSRRTCVNWTGSAPRRLHYARAGSDDRVRDPDLDTAGWWAVAHFLPVVIVWSLQPAARSAQFTLAEVRFSPADVDMIVADSYHPDAVVPYPPTIPVSDVGTGPHPVRNAQVFPAIARPGRTSTTGHGVDSAAPSCPALLDPRPRPWNPSDESIDDLDE